MPADFSTGSVGIGATATVWSALAHRYVAGHFDVPQGGRQISLLGDAELDEGAVWEAVVDPIVPRLGEVLWVVDLNRQSLDRVVPDIAYGRLAGMFEAAGWHTIPVKYGRRLKVLFDRPGGEALRARIDGMSNEEYQRALRAQGEELRHRLLDDHDPTRPARRDLERVLRDVDDAELELALRDLGGHDLRLLLDAYAEADAMVDRPIGDLRLHHQGVAATHDGAPGQPLGAAHERAVGDAGAGARCRRLGPVGPLSRRDARSRALPGGGATARARAPGTEGSAGDAAGRGSLAHGHGLHPTGLRPLLRGSRARRPGRRRAGGHGQPRRRLVDEPGRLAQPSRRVEHRRPHRLVRRRHGHSRPLAGGDPWPAHRARHRRDQPRRPPGRARVDVVTRRRTAAADRHAL